MPKPIKLTLVLRGLKKNDFEFVSQKGSHKKFTDGKRVVVVKVTKKEIPQGTLNSILGQSGLQESDFR